MAESRGPDSPREKREFFDAAAAEWAWRGFAVEDLHRLLRLKERLGDLQGLVVYEPGCGAGRLTRYLAGWVAPQGSVIAAEMSPQMAAEASRHLGLGVAAFPTEPCSERQNPGVVIYCGRAEDLPLAARSVDLVLLFCVFPHFEDHPAALARFARMLRPEGRLIIAHLEGSERLNTFHESAGEPVRRDRMPPHAALVRMLNDAGLRLTELVDREEEFFCEAVPERCGHGS